MRRDMHVLRSMMRRMTLVDGPDAIWDDEQALHVARETAAWRKEHLSDERVGPTRDELIAAMSADES